MTKLPHICYIFNFYNSSILCMRKLRFLYIKQWVLGLLYSKYGSLDLHQLKFVGNAKSSALSQTWWRRICTFKSISGVHIKVWQAVSESLWWQTEGATMFIKSYLTSDLKYETNTLLSYIIQISDDGPQSCVLEDKYKFHVDCDLHHWQ